MLMRTMIAMVELRPRLGPKEKVGGRARLCNTATTVATPVASLEHARQLAELFARVVAGRDHEAAIHSEAQVHF
jgi:hypothetical protein